MLLLCRARLRRHRRRDGRQRVSAAAAGRHRLLPDADRHLEGRPLACSRAADYRRAFPSRTPRTLLLLVPLRVPARLGPYH